MGARVPLRPLVVSLVLTVAAVWVLGPGAAPAAGPVAAPASSSVTPPETAEARMVRLLAAWDSARAAAYHRGSVTDLQALYRPGSAAGAADVTLLRGYLARGLRVEGMRMQLLAVEAVQARPGRVAARVTDRLSGSAVVAGERRVALPRDRATSRRVVLVRSGDSAWVVP